MFGASARVGMTALVASVPSNMTGPDGQQTGPTFETILVSLLLILLIGNVSDMELLVDGVLLLIKSYYIV